MNAWAIAALVFVLSHVGAGWYWHRDGYTEAERDAKAAQDDAVVAGIEAANELSRRDLERAVAAERKRAAQREAAADRRAGLERSVRTEVVYRDRDCSIPDADRVRVNAALAAARDAGAPAARGGDGPVLGADGSPAGRPADADAGAALDDRGTDRVQREATRTD